MKNLLLVAFVLGFSICVDAQTSLTKNQFGCGDPAKESQLIPEYKGKVIEVIDGNTVVVEVKHKKKLYSTYRVDLAGVDTSGNEAEAQKILKEKVLGKKVWLQGNTKEKDFMFGIIITLDKKGIGEVNRYFLEKGIAKYLAPGYEYSTSGYVLCVYFNIEEKAKEEKVGIWSK